MPTTVSDRVPDPDALRAAGLQPVQIWVPDIRRSGFAEECRRQSAIVAAADLADREPAGFMVAALAEMERTSADSAIRRLDPAAGCRRAGAGWPAR